MLSFWHIFKLLLYYTRVSADIAANEGNDTMIPTRMELKFQLDHQYLVHIKVIYRHAKFSYICYISRVTDVFAYKQEASRLEFMSLLINSMSHEMITPLSEILKLVQQQTNKEEDCHNVSRQVYQATNRLYLFVNSLLSFWQIVNDRFDPSDDTFELEALLSEVTSFFSHKCHQRKVKIVVDCQQDIEIVSDRRKLASVIHALIDNALKFSNKPDSQILIQATMLPESKNCEIKIIDQGTGINRKDMDAIMAILKKPYGTETTSSSSGLGIGLRVCQSITGALSGGTGKMNIKSLLGQGTTVSFEIPTNRLEILPTVSSPGGNPQTGQFILLRHGHESSLNEYYDERRAISNKEEKQEFILKKYINDEESQDTWKVGNRNISTQITNPSTKQIVTIKNRSIELNRPLDLVGPVAEQGLVSLQVPLINAPLFPTPRHARDSNRLIRMLSDADMNFSAFSQAIIKPSHPSKKKIMIVDDEVFLLEFLSDYLEQFSLDVYQFSSPYTAIEHSNSLVVNNDQVHMIFMDYNMPGMNGADLTRALKRDFKRSFGSTVVVALTAQDDKSVKDDFRQAGVTDFIFKPYTLAQIKEVLDKYNMV